MELVAYGAQDIYLTGNPQITFFKVVYRRHTNFAKEPVEVPFGGAVGGGKKVTVTVPRHGDLINQVWIEATVSADLTNGASAEGLSIIKNVEVEIGGQRIDKHNYRFMHGHCRLFKSTDELATLASLTRVYDNAPAAAVVPASTTGSKIMIPLQFWFCRNVGLALPLIALQYHEVKINVEFASNILHANNVGAVSVAGSEISAASLWIDYIYLDTDERRRFAQVSHEYLIEQVQYSSESLATSSGTTEKTTNIDLTFNHPVKYLMWYMGLSEDTGSVVGAGNVNNSQDCYLSAAKIQLNGHDRIPERPGQYFGNYQQHQCGLGNRFHNNASQQELTSFVNGTSEGRINNLEGLDAALATAGATTSSGVKYYMYSRSSATRTPAKWNLQFLKN